MRTGLALGSVLALTAALGAQQAPAPFDPAKNPVDQTLANWEKAMTGLQTFVAEVNRIAVDRTFQSVEQYSGTAKFIKGQRGQTSRASLYLTKVKPPAPPKTEPLFEKYVCTGNFLYVFDPGTKTLRYYEVGNAKPGQISDDNFLGLLFGMRAEDMKKRYHITYVPAPPDQAKWYVFLEILPTQQADKADFSKARLTLNVGSFLPRQLWFQQPNGNELTWDFPVDKLKVNVEIPLAEFERPALPAGWQLQKGDQPKVRN